MHAANTFYPRVVKGGKKLQGDARSAHNNVYVNNVYVKTRDEILNKRPPPTVTIKFGNLAEALLSNVLMSG